jgi:HAD superfamily hydrolase (TIGR01484 family)
MLRAVILDVDGVIIGDRIGFNSPWPHRLVTEALRATRHNGIYVCLITAKPYFAIDRIVKDAQLSNPHVTDGGSVVVDTISNVIVTKHVINKDLAQNALNLFLQNDIYVEFYTIDNYYVQSEQVCETTDQHTHILQRQPMIVPSLTEAATEFEIIKIMPIARDIEDSKRVTELFRRSSIELNLYWAVHPIALPRQFGIVVPFGISKTEGIKQMVRSLNLSFDDIVGVGDSASDWQFIELCKYGAAMGNASQELKDLVTSKGSKLSYIGPSVDQNGIIDVLNYFKIYSPSVEPIT